MELAPQNQQATPRYPTKKASFFRVAGRWIRRVGATATVVAATSFWVTGCFGISEGGAVGPDNYWVCEDEEFEEIPVDAPGAFRGELCETTTRWGVVELEEERTIRFSFDANSLEEPSAIAADVIDPGGTIVATVRPGEPAEVTMTEGTWRLAVASSNPGEGDFVLYLDLAQED